MVHTHDELDPTSTAPTDPQADAIPTKRARKRGDKAVDFTPTGIQAYYTSEALAYHIALFLWTHHRAALSHSIHTLDLCAGTGRLTRAFISRFEAQHTLTPHLVEPEHEACDQLLLAMRKDHAQHVDVRLHEMSAEEFCTTYAEAHGVEVVLCNPPFGRRIGRSQLGEDLRGLHLAELQDFEPYFLHVASKLASKLCVFLMPDNITEQPDLLPVLHAMAADGWHVDALHELPMDAYDGAKVITHLWIFVRDPDRVALNWPQAAIEAVRTRSAPALFDHAKRLTTGHRFGTITGYRMADLPTLKFYGKKEDTPPVPTHALHPKWTPAAATPLEASHPSYTSDWTPQPLARGTRVERAGKMWVLGELGFELLQGDGFADGLPASAEFLRAQRAFHYMRQGAIHTASHLLHGLALAPLIRGFGHIPAGSFLHMLTCIKPAAHPAPLRADLERCGVLTGVDHDELTMAGSTEGLHHLGTTLHDPAHMLPGQLAQLALTCLDNDHPTHRDATPCLPDWLDALLVPHLTALRMAPERLELRATWWPRTLVARLLGLALGDDGLFCANAIPPKMPWTRDAHSLIHYLNFGKTGRLSDEQRELYTDLCDQLSIALTMPEHPHIPAALRRLVTLHYLVAHSPGHPRTHVAPKAARPAKPLHPWQLDSRAKLLRGDMILNWDVGLGKTLGALAAAASHPGQTLFVVPRSVLVKWQREALAFFPQIRSAILGFRVQRSGALVTHMGALAEDAARLFYEERCQFIFTSHEVFTRLKLPRDVQQLADEFDARALVGTSAQKSVIKRREGFIQRAAGKNFRMGSDLTFNDLPLASLFVVVDEAHNFKGLFPMPSGGWGSQLIQSGGCSESKCARDMKIKLDELRKAGGKSLALTATPVLNSVAEIFNMLRIFAPGQLERLGLVNVQQLIDTFCELEHITTVGPTGNVVEGNTIVGFRQIPLLKRLWSECMVTLTAKDVDLKLPEAEEHSVEIAPTPHIHALLDQCKRDLTESVERQKRGDQATGQDHIFSILSRMDAVAAHPPLMGIEEEHPKADALIPRVLEHYRAGGNQILFLDRVQAHQPIKDRLIAAGIPADEILLLNGDETPKLTDRIEAQDRYNSGKARIAIGGQVASEGMDLQHNTVALHFLNLPWEGQTVHQRKGRGVRQGNKVEAVQIYYYLLCGSTDIYRRGLISRKNSWWADLRACQTEHMTASLVASPLDDGLLVSLARDPDLMRRMLAEKRMQEEAGRSAWRAERLLMKLVEAMNPHQPAACLPILRRRERMLRALPSLSSQMADLIVARAHTLAHLLHAAAIKRHHQLQAMPGYRRPEPPSWEHTLRTFAGMDDHIKYNDRRDMVDIRWTFTSATDEAPAHITMSWGKAELPKLLTAHIDPAFVPKTSFLDGMDGAWTLSTAELQELDGKLDVTDNLSALLEADAPDDVDLVFEDDALLDTLAPARGGHDAPQAHRHTPAATMPLASTPTDTAALDTPRRSTGQGSLLAFTATAPAQPTHASPAAKRVYTIPERGCERTRVLALLAFFAPEDVARKLGLGSSFLLTRWLRGEKKGLDLHTVCDIPKLLPLAERHFAELAHNKAAG